MGSGSSIPKCPKNYSPEKFRTILQMFDEIDDDGSHHIDTGDEKKLISVAKKVVKQRAALLHQVNSKRELEMSKIEISKRKAFEAELDEWKTKYGVDIRKTKAEIVQLNNMTNKQKCDYFIKEAGKGKELTFDRFFLYMRDKEV